ncbi:MAG: InlB B-repeat-containing protein, partial [Fibromonadales bacterium]|nr:InlB B-repeat-containing protein [Fibromonadales bacterium]
MCKLRITLFFVLAAFSATWAQCPNFDIFANGTRLDNCDNPTATAMYGDPFTLSIAPANGDIIWIGGEHILSIEAVLEPIFKNTAQILTYTVTRNGISRTINVALTQRPSYTVSFNPLGGTPTPANQSVLKDSLATEPAEILTRTGYNFKGWDFNFSTPITNHTVINAIWEIIAYTVNFETGAGNAVASQKVNHGAMIVSPPPPTRTGYDFEYWELGGVAYTFTTPVTANITLTAKWKPKIQTVEFATENEIFVTQFVEYNATATVPITSPTPPENYEFDYWALGNSQYNFNTPITQNIILTAKWKPKQFTLIFDAQGGTVSPTSKTVTYGEPVGLLPTPARYAFEFKGW